MSDNTLLNELIDVIYKVSDKDPWVNQQTVDSYFIQVESEAIEVKQAIERKDIANLKDELGDLLWNAIMMIRLAEKQNLFQMDEPIRAILEKMKRRKPYIFNNKDASIKEALRIWNEEKSKE